jgi:hypothetical protein
VEEGKVEKMETTPTDVEAPKKAVKKVSKKHTAKKKSAKKSSKPTFGSKSAFIRSLDPKLPAADVVKQAKEKGISLTLGLVYNIRRSSSSAGKRGPKRGSAAKSVGTTSAEAQLRDAIADLGLVKATEILESVRAAIRQR